MTILIVVELFFMKFDKIMQQSKGLVGHNAQKKCQSGVAKRKKRQNDASRESAKMCKSITSFAKPVALDNGTSTNEQVEVKSPCSHNYKRHLNFVEKRKTMNLKKMLGLTKDIV